MYINKIFVAFATLFNTRFDKIFTTDSPKSHNPVKSVHFIQLNFAYYAGIMLIVFAFPLCSNYAGIIGLSLPLSEIACMHTELYEITLTFS